MNKYIYIKADTNDADYIGRLSPITDEEINLVRPVIVAIKSFEGYKSIDKDGYGWMNNSNYPVGELCREDLGEKSASDLYGHLEGFEIFNDFVPYSEYGIHTIVDVKILSLVEELMYD